MLADMTRLRYWPYMLCVEFLAIVIGMGIVLNLQYTAALLLTIVVLTSFFIVPQIIIPLILVIRSSLDIFTKVGFNIGPMLLNIPSITSIVILCFGGVYIFFKASIKKDMISDKIGKVFFFWVMSLLFWVFIACSNFYIDGLIGLREWIRLASLLMIYVLSYQLTQSMDYRKIIRYIFFALPVPLFVGFYQIITSTGIKVDGINRVYGTLAHPNSFSLFLVLFIGITFWRVMASARKPLWVALLILEIVVLVNTFSVGGVLMFLVMCTILVFKMAKRQYRAMIYVLVFFVLIGFALNSAGRLRISEMSRAGNILETMKTGKLSGEGSFAWRILNWYMFIEESKKNALLGYGLGTTVEMVSPMGNIPHNDYLRFLVETGLVGLCMFFWFLISLGRGIWRVCCTATNGDLEFLYFAIIMFSVYIAWMVGSFADNFITATGFQYYFWALTGVLMAQYHKMTHLI